MPKFKKIGEIRCFGCDNIKEVLETLENQGFVLVDEDEGEFGWKTYHILKKV